LGAWFQFWLGSVCDLCDMVFPKVIEQGRFLKFKLILWSVIKSLASGEVKGGVGLRFPSGCPFPLYRQLGGDKARATAVLETQLWKPRRRYVKALNVNSKVNFIIVT